MEKRIDPRAVKQAEVVVISTPRSLLDDDSEKGRQSDAFMPLISSRRLGKPAGVEVNGRSDDED